MNESISAFMDDELEEPYSIETLKKLSGDGELQQVWHEYHLIGDAIRSNALLVIDVREQVFQKLQTEPTVIAPRRWFSDISRQRWVGGSVALAASVTLAITAGWPLLHHQSTQQNGYQAAAVKPAAAQVAVTTPAQSNNAEAQYLMAHQEMTTDPNVVRVSLSGNGDR